jgi:allantoinase
VAARGCDFVDLANWMARGPARLAGLEGRKGAIAPGHDADMVVFDPDAVDTVHGEQLEHRHKLTPYDGMPLRGRIRATYLRGERIYEDGVFTEPQGKLLRYLQ